MNKPPIIFLIGNYKNGGVARRSTTLANEMARFGRQIILLVTGEIGIDLPSLQPGVKLVQIKEFLQANANSTLIQKDEASRKRRLHHLRSLRSICSLLHLRQLVKHFSTSIDYLTHGDRLRSFFLLHPKSVVIAFSIPFVYEAYCATSGLDCTIVFAEKNASQLENPALKDSLSEAHLRIQYASACIFQTYDEMAQYDKNSLNTPVVIRNPIRPDLPQPFIGKRQSKIVNFCRLNKQKNLPLLIEAFELLHKEFKDYKLEIYGNTVSSEEEKLKQELLELIRQKKLEDSVTILPPCSNVHEKILDYAMFVSSSDFEGLSNSMLEAMAIGMPCVCTDCLGGGAREIIVDGENGLLVPVKDPVLLCNAMKRFIKSPELADKCGQNAAKIRKELAAEKIALSWLEILDSIA